AGPSPRAVRETHLPNALLSLSFSPHFALKADSPPERSVAHVPAAFLNLVACSWSSASASCSFSLAVVETHLPSAFRSLSFFPQKSAKPVGSSSRAALHSLAAFLCASCSSCASSTAFFVTQAPKLRNFVRNASRVAALLPRIVLHSVTAARLSPLSGVGLAPATVGRTRASASPATSVIFFMWP